MASPLFTLIISVYNVEAWIDEFLASLDAQAGGLDDVELLFVVDGSPDESERRIRDWLDRRDGEASIIVKENGGLSSARNTGLDAARGEWVSFPDPDDVLAPNYLEEVRQAITEFPDIDLFATRIRRFTRVVEKLTTEHPLDYRFARGRRSIDLEGTPRNLHLSAATAFFRREGASNLRFDVRIKPNFEDAALIARFLLGTGARYTVVPGAQYFYRARPDGSSLVQSSYGNPDKYLTIPEYGYLPLLQTAREAGAVPVWLQTLVLYDLQWAFKIDQQAASPTAGLAADTVASFFGFLDEIFRFIDPETILEYNATSIGMDIRIAWYLLAAGRLPEVDVHITRLDLDQQLALVRYYAAEASAAEAVLLDGVRSQAVASKTRAIRFFGRSMLFERLLWVDAMKDLAIIRDGRTRPDRLRFSGMGQSVHVATPGHIWKAYARVSPPFGARPPLSVPTRANPVERVRRGLAWRWNVAREQVRVRASSRSTRRSMRYIASVRSRRRFRDAWVLMDRDTVARDNAESLYRHIKAHRPDLNAWFVLARSSPDYDRLRRDGFKVVAYGTLEHIALMKHARHLISSQIDHYVVAPYDFGRFGRGSWKFTFLQHGVTKDDISLWINRKSVDLLITTSEREHASFVRDGSGYLVTEKEVVLTGFPRHDELLRKAERAQKDLVLVLPTWRQTLLEPISEASNYRDLAPGFEDSTYFRAWMGFLSSPELRDAAERSGVRIAFAPHPNLQPHLARFRVPEWIELLDYSDGDVKDWIARARVVVSDYSSLGFDAAFAHAPVVYYQFDHESFFGGGHAYRKGEFDYARDGFGPVAFDSAGAVAATITLIERGVTDEALDRRIQDAFAFRDGRSSERVVAAIEALTRRAVS